MQDLRVLPATVQNSESIPSKSSSINQQLSSGHLFLFVTDTIESLAEKCHKGKEVNVVEMRLDVRNIRK